jgi:hypothetical protein
MTTSEPLTEQWLSDVLTELGPTADDIAASLRTAKITGDRNDPSTCPIARYLAQRVRQAAPSCRITAISVSTRIRVGVDVPDTGYCSVAVETPEAVDQFITAFDKEAAYPDLVADYAA